MLLHSHICFISSSNTHLWFAKIPNRQACELVLSEAQLWVGSDMLLQKADIL